MIFLVIRGKTKIMLEISILSNNSLLLMIWTKTSSSVKNIKLFNYS